MYLVTERVSGIALTHEIAFWKVRGEMMPVDRALTIGVKLFQALDALHRFDLIHRDLKPDNIKLPDTSNAGQGAITGLKLLDFGIALSIRDDETRLTRNGETPCTLEYASPEQCRGDALGRLSDIYSAGLVLYEMLCGAIPFADRCGANALLYAKVMLTPAPIGNLRPDLSGSALEKLVAELLAIDPMQRPESARLVAARLESEARSL